MIDDFFHVNYYYVGGEEEKNRPGIPVMAEKYTRPHHILST